MKRTKTFAVCAAISAALAAALALGGCANAATYVTSIKKTGSDGRDDIYTISYSDGSSEIFTVSNGEDGSDADIYDIFEAYREQPGNEQATFEEFLSEYLTLNTDTSSAIAGSLRSVAKIYAEFVTTEQGIGFDPSTGRPQLSEISDIAVSTGAAVIYAMNESDDGYTYFVTDYHVVYNHEADSSKNGGSKIARTVHAYLYGSEGAPSAVDEDGDGRADADENGYTIYDYGDDAIALEYVGGTITYDIAVLRAKTSEVHAVNDGARAVSLADGYLVGETAIAIGNPEGSGLSVTQGIISTDSEYITLQIDDTVRSYRSVRIDTALYSGNSGGGLFNKNGELIGITNAGNKTDQNINYAVPLEIVCATADAIIRSANDGSADTGGVYRLTLGVTVAGQHSKYVYDAESGCGYITEEVIATAVSEGSLAERLGLIQGDRLECISVNGAAYTIDRTFRPDDILISVCTGDIVQISYERDGIICATQAYTVAEDDLAHVA